MKRGEQMSEDPGQYEVWLVGGSEDFLWLSGLVRLEDAQKLAEQANTAAITLGKAGAYVVRRKESAA